MHFDFYALSAFVNFIVSISFGVFVYTRDTKDHKNIGFFLLTFFVGFLNFFYFFWITADTATAALFFVRLLMAFLLFVPSSSLYFIIAVTGELEGKKRFIVLDYMVFCLFLLVAFTPAFLKNFHPAVGINYWPSPEPLFTLFLIFYFLNVIYQSYLLLKNYRTSKGIAHLQMKYVSIGIIISYIGGSCNFLAMYGIPFPPVLNILTSVYVILIGYAMTRYRLMDIRIIARKFLFYAGLSVAVYAMFYAISGLYLLIFGSVFSTAGFIVGLAVAPLCILGLYQMSDALMDFINQHIFYSLYNYEETLYKISKELNNYVNLDTIVSILVNNLRKVFGLGKIALFILDQNNTIQNLDAVGFNQASAIAETDASLLVYIFQENKKIIEQDEIKSLVEKEQDENKKRDLLWLQKFSKQTGAFLYVPLLSAEKMIGILILGEKFGNESYAKEDLDLLRTIAYQAGIAIDNAKLYKTIDDKNKNLQELVSAKDDFIRIANHQLNTPLSIMKNAYAMVQDNTLTQKEGIGYWGNALKRMSQVVENFWDTFQSEGQMQSNPQKTDIAAMLRDIVKEKKLAVKTLKKDIKILIQKPDFEIPTVLCDPKQVNSVFSNLLDNATFYTPKGSITVWYELVKSSAFLKVNVQDTGIGFSAEEKTKIGGKFYRAKKAPLYHTDGSGLGVYICKKIIENNKGELTCQSPGENKGSTFSVSLPIFE